MGRRSARGASRGASGEIARGVGDAREEGSGRGARAGWARERRCGGWEWG